MINAHISVLSSKYVVGGAQQSHQQLTEMVDIMNAVAELAQERTTVWREICLEQVLLLSIRKALRNEMSIRLLS